MFSRETIKRGAYMKHYDRSMLYFLDDNQKKQAYKQMVPLANRRLRELEKRGVLNESIAKKLDVYYRFNKEYSEHNYMEIVRFMSAETSTITGIKKARKNIRAGFENVGIKFKSQREYNDFIKFLESKQYRLLRRKYDSQQIAESFLEMYEDNLTLEEIMKQFAISDIKERIGKKL